MADTSAEKWLEDHGDALYRYAMMKLQDSEQAADMVQETLLAAWQGREKFAGNASLRTWLIGIMKHKIIDLIRKSIHQRDLADELGSDPTSPWFEADGSWQAVPQAWQGAPEQLCENEQFRQILMRCMSALPERQRMAFSMREVSGDDSDEVCKALDVSTTNLHVLIHRARLALRVCLEKNWFAGSRQ